ncbi:MAG: SUMF1/EgtB/PvdO family nonheme iron enzyme [Deltaproteobacteria bacterium]|nr:SUMF1/EgtB/PvdO family nonheme iron enzyme [Deltaproteobacteria bacterium]
MTDDTIKRLAQLRKAYESGILDEDTYQATLAAMGIEAEAQIIVDGSGSVALNGGTSAGAGGVAVGGDIHGNVYVGAPTKEPDKALRIYRRVLARSSCYLPLRGVDLGASDPECGQQRLDLARVYVDLDTKSRKSIIEDEKKSPMDEELLPERHESRPVRALEAACDNPILVLLGDPGSGKSTFLNHLALCLAAHSLEPEAGWLDRLSGWPADASDVLPIPVVLRDFARWMPENKKKAVPRHQWDFILNRLESQNLGFAADSIHDTLERGKALVLMDGLDEIPEQSQRSFIRDAVVAFHGRYPDSRLIVTCRVLSYQDKARQLAGFPVFEMAPFEEEKIDTFIEAWYAELARLGEVKTLAEAKGLAGKLKTAVRRTDLWRLAPNPLLLTVMALVHTHKGRLPEARSMLYEETGDLLLWRWGQIKVGGEDASPKLRKLLLEADRAEVDLKRVLWDVAFHAHQSRGADETDTLADIEESRLETAIAELHPTGSLKWARSLIDTIKLRAGLLIEREPGVYTFPHRTFQEYMAGAHLAIQPDFAKLSAALASEGSFWREVVLLAAGRLVYLGGESDRPLAMVSELCPSSEKDDEVSWRNVWLAGDALLEIGLNRVQDTALGRDLLIRLRDRLSGLLQLGRLNPMERAAAGETLAYLEDPRKEVTTIPHMTFCIIPAGPFQMGEGEDLHPNDRLEYNYWMGKYPVTNAQYAAFVKSGGYRERRLWTEAEKAEVWKNGKVKGRFEGDFRDHPWDFGTPFDLSNYPVVGVTWYEALAFCRWLTETWKKAKQLPNTWSVRLPTEAEWEKAARGGLELPEKPLLASIDQGLGEILPDIALVVNSRPEREFPWGETTAKDKPNKNRANYDDSGIGSTSAVGCFPEGVSPYGCNDMAGNVWEWTHSLWGEDWNEPAFKYPYDQEDGREDETAGKEIRRVLRGGSFFDPVRPLRCAYRYWFSPAIRFGYLGFRVVVAPGLL